MSKLYATESGRAIPVLSEELTRFRWARKVLALPDTKKPAQLYVLARFHEGTDFPLHITINGHALEPAMPREGWAWGWIVRDIDSGQLRPGQNLIEFHTDATAMTAWELAIEPGHPEPASFASDDAGASWRNDRMAYLNAVRGEYVVRIRLGEGEDPDPSPMVWEDSTHPRVASLRESIPENARGDAPFLDRVRVISAWIAGTFEHTSSGRTPVYAPWDAETILNWGASEVGHEGFRACTMCVHYAVAFVSACQVLAIPARCAITTSDIHGSKGHFVAEVWHPELEKWFLVDPNCDYIVVDGDVPLSLPEVRALGPRIRDCIVWGEGTDYQREFSHIVRFIEDVVEKNICYQHISIWPRADFLSRPELAPPAHGALSYCETDIVWEAGDIEHGFGMFRYFGDEAYFNAAPG